MKLQSLAIIFIIIVFPMILALSYYISLQIDTVTLYNKYNNELIDATNDAMAAFELNTANEKLSNVSDSLRTIVDASTNTFINTFSTSLGLSNAHKDELESYIPSILYTMYDGYYIYSPTMTPMILEKTKKEGELVISEGAAYSPEGELLYKKSEDDTVGTTNLDEAKIKTDYVLKSYMPYSATYIEGTNTATINYTLDNFLSISAQIGDVYYTKSGYYIDTSLLVDVSGTDNSGNTINIDNIFNYGQDELKEICRSGRDIKIKLRNCTEEIVYSSYGLNIEENEKKLEECYKEYQNLIYQVPRDNAQIAAILEQIQNLEESLAKNKAITYYLTNTVFSNWVNDNLEFVKGENLKTVIDFEHPKNIGYSIENMNMIYHNFETEGKVFNEGDDPENEESVFNNHKYNIIKNSIQYNLNLAISSYNNMFKGIDFAMPQISDLEWEQITEKISIVSFAQGLNCGLKLYNGYAVISSTNNEMTVIPEEVYYVKKSEFNNENSYYHRIDCAELLKESGGAEYSGDFISFKSKEVKYDDIYLGEKTGGEGYEYDHKNLGCYDCIVQNNYSNYNDGTKDKKIKLRAFLNFEPDNYDGINYINNTVSSFLQKAYYIAIGKERQNLYKTTAYSKNEGIKLLNGKKVEWNDEISKIEVNLEYKGTPSIVGKIYVGTQNTDRLISTSTKAIQTVEIINNGQNGDILCYIEGDPNPQNIDVKSIKYIYK